jgi:hypothetical protein
MLPALRRCGAVWHFLVPAMTFKTLRGKAIPRVQFQRGAQRRFNYNDQ